MFHEEHTLYTRIYREERPTYSNIMNKMYSFTILYNIYFLYVANLFSVTYTVIIC